MFYSCDPEIIVSPARRKLTLGPHKVFCSCVKAATVDKERSYDISIFDTQFEP